MNSSPDFPDKNQHTFYLPLPRGKPKRSKGLRAGRPRKVSEIVNVMFQLSLPFNDEESKNEQ